MNLFRKQFGMEYNHLYEILATSIRDNPLKKKIIPNTAAMGIRLVENNIIKIAPYPTTQTYKNLKENGVIILNLVDNVYLFALAALKEPDSPIGLKKFPKEKYHYIKVPNKENLAKNIPRNTVDNLNGIPYIKSANGILICKVIDENDKIKKNKLGEIKITEFQLNCIFHKKFKESVKLFNRADNLALESIILATRLKIAYEKQDQELCSVIYNQILNYRKDIARFSKNKNANETMKLIDNYIRRYS